MPGRPAEGHGTVADDRQAAAGRRPDEHQPGHPARMGEREAECAQGRHAVTGHVGRPGQPEDIERFGSTVQHLAEGDPAGTGGPVLARRVESADLKAAPHREGSERTIDHRAATRGVRVREEQQQRPFAPPVDGEPVVHLRGLRGLIHALPPLAWKRDDEHIPTTGTTHRPHRASRGCCMEPLFRAGRPRRTSLRRAASATLPMLGSKMLTRRRKSTRRPWSSHPEGWASPRARRRRRSRWPSRKRAPGPAPM